MKSLHNYVSRWKILVGVLGALATALGPAPSQPTTADGGCSPARLRAEMADIGRVTHGPVGAAVLVVEDGPVVAWHGERHLPMQSVYKLPIAMAVLHQVDAGRLTLSQPVRITPGDLVPATVHSPLAVQHPQGTVMTVEALLDATLQDSDGTASDVLMRLVGGPERVTAYLRTLGIRDIVVATTEWAMGQNEQTQYRNWATATAMAELLRAVQQGRGLSASSHSRLLGLMAENKAGRHQIRGLLPPGTAVADRTGSSGTIHGLTRATNDAGLVTLPDGRHLAVVVFVSDTRVDTATREAVIAKIARAAWDCRARTRSNRLSNKEK